MDRLIVMSGGFLAQQHAIPEEQPGADAIVFVGRGENNTIRLDTPSVSKRHCSVRRRMGQIYVTDLGSANGSVLNGMRVAPFQDVEVFDGDTLVIRPFTLRFDLPRHRRGASQTGRSSAPEAGEASSHAARAMADARLSRGGPSGAGGADLLVISRDGRSFGSMAIARDALAIGSDADCDLKLEPAPDIEPYHLELVRRQRRHFAFVPSDAIVTLNQAKVLPRGEDVPLHHGDVLTIGAYTLQCVLTSALVDGNQTTMLRVDRRLLEEPPRESAASLADTPAAGIPSPAGLSRD